MPQQPRSDSTTLGPTPDRRRVSAARALTAAVVAAVAAVAVPAPAAADAAMFRSLGCDDCHTVSKAKIDLSESPKIKEGEEPADLSEVGKAHDKMWIAKFVLKKVEKDGKKHKPTYEGSPQDLVKLATWLAGLAGK